jgi:hypothetical protein
MAFTGPPINGESPGWRCDTRGRYLETWTCPNKGRGGLAPHKKALDRPCARITPHRFGRGDPIVNNDRIFRNVGLLLLHASV